MFHSNRCFVLEQVNSKRPATSTRHLRTATTHLCVSLHSRLRVSPRADSGHHACSDQLSNSAFCSSDLRASGGTRKPWLRRPAVYPRASRAAANTAGRDPARRGPSPRQRSATRGKPARRSVDSQLAHTGRRPNIAADDPPRQRRTLCRSTPRSTGKCLPKASSGGRRRLIYPDTPPRARVTQRRRCGERHVGKRGRHGGGTMWRATSWPYWSSPLTASEGSRRELLAPTQAPANRGRV